MNGAITESGGARSLTKTGASQFTLGRHDNTYTGGTNLNGGVVTFTAPGSLGTGPLTFDGGTLQYGTGCHRRRFGIGDYGEPRGRNDRYQRQRGGVDS